MESKKGMGHIFMVILLGLLVAQGVSAAGGTVVLTWQGWDPISKYQPLIDEYQKRNPTVQVQYSSFPDYKTRILTGAVSGTLPDIIGVGTGNVLDFASAGILLEVGPSFKQDAKYAFNDFWESVLPFITYNGKIYAAPCDGGTYALVYNKKMFDQAGVAYPSDKWTWDDYLAAAKKLVKTANNKVTRYASVIDGNGGMDSMAGFIQQNGGSLLTADLFKSALDRPEACDAIQWVKNLDTQYHVVAPIESLASIPLPIASMINSGTIAMGRVGLWETKVLKDSDVLDWAVAPMPKGKAGRGEILFINGLGVSAKSKNAAQAVDLLKFATSHDGEEILLRHTGDPQIAVRKSLRDVAIASFEKKRNAGAFIDAMQYSQYWPLISKLSEINAVANRNLTKVLIEGQPAKQVMTAVAAEQNKILSEAQ